MIILDSNIWIAFLNKSDSQYKKAKKLFETINGKIFITEYIILEVCSVLNMRASKKIANNFLELIIDNSDVDIIFSDKEFFLAVTDTFVNNKSRKLSFVDNSLIYLSATYNVKTFDKELAKIVGFRIK